MNILLIFNTKNLPNVGCRATSLGLEALYKEHALKSIFAEDIFRINREISASYLFKFVYRYIGLFPFLMHTYIDRYIQKDKSILDAIQSTEIVVINGEGAVHHRRITALILLAIGNVAHKAGKKVCVVNATLSDLDKVSINTLRSFDQIVTRDQITDQYLSSLDIGHVSGADAAWIFLSQNVDSSGKLRPRTKSKKIIFTSAVNTPLHIVDDIIRRLRSRWELTYLCVDPLGVDMRTILCKNKIPIVSALELFERDRTSLFDFLSGFDLAISGRHHINIFLYYLGVPVIPIRSNTHKIEGTLLMLGAEEGFLNKPVSVRSGFIADPATKSDVINMAQSNLVV